MSAKAGLGRVLIGAGLANVRYAPGSDQIPHRNEMTRCAKRGQSDKQARQSVGLTHIH